MEIRTESAPVGGRRTPTWSIAALSAVAAGLALGLWAGRYAVDAANEPLEPVRRAAPVADGSTVGLALLTPSQGAGPIATDRIDHGLRRGAGAALSVRVETERGVALPRVRVEFHQGGRVVCSRESDAAGIVRATRVKVGRVGIALRPESLPTHVLPPVPMYGVTPRDGGGAVCRQIDLSASDATLVQLSLPTKARLLGRVSREDGLPLADVPVTVLALDAPIARRVSRGRTDAQGNFSFEHLGAGRHLVKGISGAEGSVRSLPMELLLATGDVRWLDVRAGECNGSLGGCVRDARGDPVRGLQLNALHGTNPLATTFTDDQGRFAFAALPRELLRLEVSPRATSGSGLFGLRKVRASFPARDVDLRTQDVDVGHLFVERPRRFTLRGRVTSEGARSGSVRVRATYLRRDGSSGHSIELPVDARDRFRFECEETVHRIRIEASDGHGRRAATELQPELDLEIERTLALRS